MNINESNKVKSYIGFAIKSQKALFGADMIISSRVRPHVVLIDEDINRSSKSRVIDYCDKRKITLIIIDGEMMSSIVSKNNCKAIAILDKSLAGVIKEECGVL